MVNIGAPGRRSDGGIFRESVMGKKFYSNKINLIMNVLSNFKILFNQYLQLRLYLYSLPAILMITFL